MRFQRIHAQRPGDVLDPLLAHIAENVRKLVANMIAHRAREANPAWLGQRLQSRGDIDAVAVDVVAVDDHVADIDPDAKFDAAVYWFGGIALSHRALHLDCTAHRIDDASEFDEEAVAGGLDSPTVMLGDFG